MYILITSYAHRPASGILNHQPSQTLGSPKLHVPPYTYAIFYPQICVFYFTRSPAQATSTSASAARQLAP